jgi:hypothetical protein
MAAMNVETNITGKQAFKVQQQAVQPLRREYPAETAEKPIIPTGRLFDTVGVKLDLSKEAQRYIEKARSVKEQIASQAVRQRVMESVQPRLPESVPANTAQACAPPARASYQLDIAV